MTNRRKFKGKETKGTGTETEGEKRREEREREKEKTKDWGMGGTWERVKTGEIEGKDKVGKKRGKSQRGEH